MYLFSKSYFQQLRMVFQRRGRRARSKAASG